MKSGELKKKWKYLFCFCPWLVSVFHNEKWMEDTFIWFIYNNASKKKNKLKALEGNDGKTLVSEGIDANYQDIINYAVFALIHLKDFEE